MKSADSDNRIFWQSQSIEDLAKEQQVKPVGFEELSGKGRDLWETNEAFEQFLAELHDRRHEMSHA